MLWFSVFALCLVLAVQVIGELNIDIKKYEMCEGIDTKIKFTAKFERKNASIHMLDATGSTPIPIGDNIMIHFIAQLYENGEWTTVLNLDEKDPCQLLNDYVGEVWHKIQEQVGMPVDKCPIPKGDYKVSNYVMDASQMTIQTIPKGMFRVSVNATQGEELVLCARGEFESK